MWVLGNPSQTLVPTKMTLESIRVSASGAVANTLLASGAWRDVQVPHGTARVGQLQDSCLPDNADFLCKESVEW